MTLSKSTFFTMDWSDLPQRNITARRKCSKSVIFISPITASTKKHKTTWRAKETILPAKKKENLNKLTMAILPANGICINYANISKKWELAGMMCTKESKMFVWRLLSVLKGTLQPIITGSLGIEESALKSMGLMSSLIRSLGLGYSKLILCLLFLWVFHYVLQLFSILFSTFDFSLPSIL